MRSDRDVRENTATLERLRAAIDALVNIGHGVQRSLATGWTDPHTTIADECLIFGAIHEWFGLATTSPPPSHKDPQQLKFWTPPLSVLVHLAARSQLRSENGPGPPCAVVLWIGRRVRPYGHSLQRVYSPLFDSSICVDAQNAEQRFWSIDVALRCAGSGAVVIADASGLPLAVSRRLQLAAEAGGSLALLARPPWEESELSVAATRWRVRAVAASAEAPRWSIELVRCKGSHAHASHAQAWTVERTDDGRLISLSPGMADGPRSAAIAS